MSETTLSKTTLEKIISWQNVPFDKQTQEKVKILFATQKYEAIEDAFYKDLSFGTGGMRGIMGLGTNRINQYTVGRATQGLANYLQKKYASPIKVAIAYDCRNNSDTLAQTVADVLTANNINVFLFDALRSTPELSFTVRHLSCQAGIVLTASHNPPKYNGYKVYNNEGGQIIPPEDAEIISAIEKVNYENILFIPNKKRLKIIGEDIDKTFIKTVLESGISKKQADKNLKIVFTPLHGTAITLIPDLLKKAGYQNVHIVAEQAIPDGNFPTVHSPNPENPDALKMAIQTAQKQNADIVIGTDPDSDRLGIAVKNDKSYWTILNGNQTMILMTDYLLKNNQNLSKKDFVATTIVSTPMVKKLAKNYGVDCKISLTGFKWIGKMISDFPEQNFLCGGEESFGYMVGDFVRDKDAITATLLACEMALDAKEKNSGLYEKLNGLYKKYGVYVEELIAVTKEGKKGVAIINEKMNDLRKNHPLKIADERVKYFFDYKSGIVKNLQTGVEKPAGLPKSNVLIFETEKGTRVAARPSGTEPKIKFYISVNAPVKESVSKTKKALKMHIKNIIQQLNLHC